MNIAAAHSYKRAAGVIHRRAERHHEAGDTRRNLRALLEAFERQRQRRGRRRGGKRGQQRGRHGRIQPPRIHARHRWQAGSATRRNHRSQAPPPRSRRTAARPGALESRNRHDLGDEREHADGREHHHEAGHAHHDEEDALPEAEHRALLGLRDARQEESEQDREQHQAEHLGIGRGLDDVRRYDGP